VAPNPNEGRKGATWPPYHIDNGRVNVLLSKLMAMFESGEFPPAIARTVIKRCDGGVPSDSWSLGNRILMLIQGTQDARGYRQWENTGRFVKKGSSAIYILAPLKKQMPVEVVDSNTGERRTERRPIIIGFKGIPVFRVEDTDGDPLPDPPSYNPPKRPPLHEVAGFYNIDIIYAPFDGCCYGFYTWQHGKMICLHTHDIKTWFHELGHAIHGSFHELKKGQVPEQEIVAELFAAAMCELHGVYGYHQYSWEYIKSYAGFEPDIALKAIMKVIGDVEECFKRVFEITDLGIGNVG